MGKKNLYMYGRGLLFLWILFALPTLLSVHAEEKERIRVGVYNAENYDVAGSSGKPLGYDYEYLNKIATYTGWEYEYVQGSLGDCLEMLAKGEIDLLSGLEKTQQRESVLCFTETATMFVSSCLLQPVESDRYAYEDFENFNGMRIGSVRATALNAVLQQYSEEKGFHYELVLYDTGEEVKEALMEGEIDSACLGSNRDLSQFSVLAYFGYNPRYCAVNPKRPELAEQIDEALKQIWVREPEFEYELYEKHFSYSKYIAFTKEELEYIRAQSEPIQVGLYMDIGRLLCRYDNKTGTYTGLAVDSLNLLADRIGLKFAYEPIPDGGTPATYLREHPDAVVAPAMTNSLISHDSGYLHLNPIIKGRMLTVIRRGETLDLNGKFRLAVPTGLYSAADLIAKAVPNAEVTAAGTHWEALRMVADGKADMALVNEITAAYQMQNPFLKELQTSRLLDITEDITLGLSYEADPELISILNKGIASVGERDARQLVVNNTAAVSYDMTTGQWIYKNRNALLLLAVILVSVLLLLYQMNKNRKRRDAYRQELMLAEQRLKSDQDYQKKLFRQANYDALTGIYNGSYFVQRANERMKEEPEPVYTFLQINLVKFKMLNDLYGTEAGDAVLCRIAEQLHELVGSRGVYGRLYADQFAVCMPLDPEKLEREVKNNGVLLIHHKKRKIRVELDVGVFVDTQRCLDAAQAIDCAKIALESESNEENQYLFYFRDADMEILRTRQRISNEMEGALEDGQFHVYLQPQFNIISHCLIGAEALVRWIHPRYGVISPAEFIPVFEQNHFIYRLDAYMCDKVCEILAGWLAQGRAVPISVNLSQVDLKNPNLISMLQGTLERHGVPNQYLHLEITESAYVDDRQQLKRVIAELKEIGFCIEMDDFGSGYSSLNMLKEIPVDILKLDMKFLEGESQMGRSGNIITSVVNTAHAAGMLVIVEGVETERQANFLRSIGCNFVQGYLMGRPVPSDGFRVVMESNPIGEKHLDIEQNRLDDVYWKVEALECLLKNDQAILFNYDPEADRAVFTFMDAGDQRSEIVTEHYAATLEENPLVHPDYRSVLKEALTGGSEGVKEIDFLGDYYGKGQYERFRATAYYYYYYYKKEYGHRRTIAVMKRL